MAHGHDHAAHADDDFVALTPADEEYRSTPAGSEYEHTDASVWAITKFGLWLLVSAVVIHVGLAVLYLLYIRQADVTATRPYPLASSLEPRLPPQPRLQQFPRTDMYDFRRGEEEQLNSYGWMNKDAGTVHIPVSEAMKLLVERGALQSRPEDAAQPAQTPGLMPSDASAGRVMERRRQ